MAVVVVVGVVVIGLLLLLLRLVAPLALLLMLLRMVLPPPWLLLLPLLVAGLARLRGPRRASSRRRGSRALGDLQSGLSLSFWGSPRVAEVLAAVAAGPTGSTEGASRAGRGGGLLAAVPGQLAEDAPSVMGPLHRQRAPASAGELAN